MLSGFKQIVSINLSETPQHKNVSAFHSLLHGRDSKSRVEKLLIQVLHSSYVYHERVSHADTPHGHLLPRGSTSIYMLCLPTEPEDKRPFPRPSRRGEANVNTDIKQVLWQRVD